MPLERVLALRHSRLQSLQEQLAPLLRGRSALTLEIGSGHGHYLCGYATVFSEEFCLGIDIMAERLARAGRKSKRAGLANIVWLHAEASLLLEALPAHVSLQKIIVLFPDPWPKRRHWKNRLIQPAFLSALAARAGEEARLYFRTDFASYFDEARQIVASDPHWQLSTDEPWPFELETVFQRRAESHHSFIARRRAAT